MAWPSHPFTFNVPYQDQPLRSPVIVARRTPEAIRATVVELLRGFEDDEWIYWCIDDKYPIRLIEQPVAVLTGALLDGAFAEADGLLLCRCRKLLRHEHLLDDTIDGPAGIRLLRRRDYSQIWIHQFLRTKVLRHLFSSFPEFIPNAKIMDGMKDRIALPADHRLYVVESNLVVFGESTKDGRVTRNCARSFRELGMDLPAGFEPSNVEAIMGTVH